MIPRNRRGRFSSEEPSGGESKGYRQETKSGEGKGSWINLGNVRSKSTGIMILCVMLALTLSIIAMIKSFS